MPDTQHSEVTCGTGFEEVEVTIRILQGCDYHGLAQSSWMKFKYWHLLLKLHFDTQFMLDGGVHGVCVCGGCFGDSLAPTSQMLRFQV